MLERTFLAVLARFDSCCDLLVERFEVELRGCVEEDYFLRVRGTESVTYLMQVR
jgi:hypothetical protein